MKSEKATIPAKIYNMVKRLMFSGFILLIFNACNNKISNDLPGISTIDSTAKIHHVDAVIISKGVFYREIKCNGKLKAFQRAEIRFNAQNTISNIYVSNGDYVSKGKIIASQDNYKEDIYYKQARDQFNRAKLDLQNILIGQGYKIEDSSAIPENILKISKIKSNYNQAFNNLLLKKKQYENTVLKAPISGKIANLNTNIHTSPQTGKPFCIILDDSRLEVDFNILESERSQVKIGTRLAVVPFSDTIEYIGTITEINPLIDENGFVRVKGIVPNKGGKLIEGMNVNICIQQPIPDQIFVPKDAVVMRTGRKVVFTYSKGLSTWNYVETGIENSRYFTITKGLNDGDTVLVSGNLNIGYGVPLHINTFEE